MSTYFSEEHELFRRTVRLFAEEAIKPYANDWEQAGIFPRELFAKAGDSDDLTEWVALGGRNKYSEPKL